jgi:hypothetical protein
LLTAPRQHAVAALASLDMIQGLAVVAVHARLDACNRLEEMSQRSLAFYLTEMADRQLHQATGLVRVTPRGRVACRGTAPRTEGRSRLAVPGRPVGRQGPRGRTPPAVATAM